MEFSYHILHCCFKGKWWKFEDALVYICLHLVYIPLRPHVFTKNQVKADTNCKNNFKKQCSKIPETETCLGICLVTGQNKRTKISHLSFSWSRKCWYKTNNFSVFIYLYLPPSYSILHVWLDTMEMHFIAWKASQKCNGRGFCCKTQMCSSFP